MESKMRRAAHPDEITARMERLNETYSLIITGEDLFEEGENVSAAEDALHELNGDVPRGMMDWDNDWDVPFTPDAFGDDGLHHLNR